MAAEIRIPHEVAEKIRYYVYALRDPRDGRVFYVGKGRGGRINAHLREAGKDKGGRINSHLREAGKDQESERQKLRRINEIESSGHEIELLFLRTEIEDEDRAFMVE